MDLNETMEAMVWWAVHWWSWLRRMWRCRSHVGLCHMRGWNPLPSLCLGFYFWVGWLGEVVLPQFMLAFCLGASMQRYFLGDKITGTAVTFLRFWSCKDLLLCWAIMPGDTFSRLKSPTIQHWPENFFAALGWVPQTWFTKWALYNPQHPAIQLFHSGGESLAPCACEAVGTEHRFLGISVGSMGSRSDNWWQWNNWWQPFVPS